MTTLDERLRAATEALGDGPGSTPSFGALQRRHRRRRRGASVAAASVLVVCGAVAFAVRGGGGSDSTPPVGSTAPTSTTVARTTTTLPSAAPGIVHLPDQPLAGMSHLPASDVHVVSLSSNIGPGQGVLAGGALWTIGGQASCNGPTCPWLFRIDPATGHVTPEPSPDLGGQQAGPLAIGDGGAFVVTFRYDGSPMRVMGIDLTTGRPRFSTAIPGTSVQGNPKARLTFGGGKVWLSEGAMPVVELDPVTGAIDATIPLPGNGGETNGNVRTVFDRFGLWLVGGNSGTAVILVDPATKHASVFNDFGPGFSQSLAADDTHVWTTHFAGNPAALDLTRLDLAHPNDSKRAGIPTPQVAVGSGQVWFMGYEPAEKANDPANHYGVVGVIDPVTLKVLGIVEIPGIGPLDDPQLFVGNGSAWVYDSAAQTIARITSP